MIEVSCVAVMSPGSLVRWLEPWCRAPAHQRKRSSVSAAIRNAYVRPGTAQLAHLLVAHPDMRHVWIVLGLFFVLWWTWVGFAVLSNRHGADDPAQRLLFLAGQRAGRRRGGRDRAGVDRATSRSSR